MGRVRSAARNGARMALAGATVTLAAGWSAAQAETWQQRLDALEGGAPAKLDLGAPQLAQETGSEAPITLNPVTVEGQGEDASGPVDGYVANESTTGSKTDTPIIETPQSISVISAERLEEQAASSLGDALRYSAGVTGELFGLDQRGYGMRIRGFEVDNNYYRDGLQYKGTSFVSFLPLDVYGAERLEILRGPASVLYGQASPGGILNYVSKRATAEPQYEVQAGFGTFDRYQGKFDFSGHLTEDGALSYRVTGLGRDSDTQTDFVNDDRLFIAPTLTWQGEDTTVTLLANYQHDDQGWGIQFLPASGTVLDNPNGRLPRHTFTGEPDFDKYILDQFSVGYQVEHHVDDVFTVRQNAHYAELENDQEIVYGVGLADDRTLNRFADTGHSELSTVAVDNQVQAKFETGPIAHTGLFGVDFQHYDFSDRGAGAPIAPIDIYDPEYGADIPDLVVSTDGNTKQRQIGLYVQEQAKLFDKLVVLLGGRYDFAKTEFTNDLENTEQTVNDEAFTGRAGLVYLFDNGLAPYFSYSESFQPLLETDANGNPFKPEEGRQYEVGLKYQPTGWNSSVMLSLFDIVKKNVLTPDPLDPANNQVQTGEVRHRGIELEGVASFDFGLDLTAAYTFLDAEVTKSNAAGEEGNRPGRVPKHSASLWADYTIPEGDFAGLGFGAGVRYIGPSFGDNLEDLRLPGYTLADAAIHYEWDNFKFALNGSNIFDKVYVPSCFGETSCFYGERRTVFGTITYRW
jgi:iron complex outermembrane receptor protein